MTVHIDPKAPVFDLLEANPCSGDAKRGAARFWTTREIRVLTAVYPAQGLAGAVEALPGRSAKSVYCMAGRFKLKGPAAPKASRPRNRQFVTTPHLDDAIRRAYAEPPGADPVGRLVELTGWPRHQLRRRALSLGLVVPRFKAADWSEAEIDLLREAGGVSIEAAQRRLKAAGYQRSLAAVETMRKKLKIRLESDESSFTTTGLGLGLGVSKDTVARWIERGLLKGQKRRVRSGNDPDRGAYRIKRKAARQFVIDNAALVDFRKVDKAFVIELLAERRAL